MSDNNATIKMVRKKLDEASDIGVKQFSQSVCPIYGVSYNCKPVHIGSALLILWKEKQYLVTAAHIIDNNDESTIYLGVGSSLEEISAEFLTTKKPNDDRKKDYYDFAWTEISNLKFINDEELVFIDEMQISTNSSSYDENAYLAFGYPNSKNKKHDINNCIVKSKFMSYISTLDNNKAWFTERSLNYGDHILLKYDKRHAKGKDGVITNTLSPAGLSGGALIDMGSLAQTESYRSNYKLKGYLAGMIIEKSDEHNILISVRIGFILDQIEKHTF